MRTELKDLYKICDMLLEKMISIADINEEYKLLSPEQIEVIDNVFDDAYKIKKEIFSLLYMSGIE